jgi:hypothetical protein
MVKIISLLLSILGLTTLYVPVFAQPLGEVPRAKTTQSVVDNAVANRSQKLLVSLDDDEIMIRFRRDFVIGGSAGNAAVISTMRAELANLKSEIFPGGKLYDIIIEEDYDALAMVLVTINNMRQLQALLDHPKIKGVHENSVYKPALAETLPLIGQPAAVATGKKGGNTRIAVLDTGGDVEAIDFSKIAKAPACKPPGDTTSKGDPIGTGNCKVANALNFSESSSCWSSLCSNAAHGTGVGSIAARTAPDARISLLQIFTPSGLSDAAKINRAINWVVSNAGTSSGKIVAMNMSFVLDKPATYSFPCTASPLYASIKKTIDADVVPVASSGNDAIATGVSDPACVPGVVSVGAVVDYASSLSVKGAWGGVCDQDPFHSDDIPCYSNSGTLLKLLAVGSGVTIGTGSIYTGTSIASPQVSGAVAILRGSGGFPTEPISRTISRMTANGKPITDPRNGLVRPRLNISAAASDSDPPVSADLSVTTTIYQNLLLTP